MNTAFYSQTNGQMEQQNQILKHYLCCYNNEQQLNWAGLLLFAEFIYNWSKYTSTEVSSFYVYAGYKLKVNFKVKNKFQLKKVSAVWNQFKHLQQIREVIAKNLKYAQIMQQKYYNKKHYFKEFYKKEFDLLNIKNLQIIRFSKKLSHKYIRSFCVEKFIET